MKNKSIKNIKEASTEDLKKAWDQWDGFSLSMGFEGEEIHAELNLRWEGVYCAI